MASRGDSHGKGVLIWVSVLLTLVLLAATDLTPGVTQLCHAQETLPSSVRIATGPPGGYQTMIFSYLSGKLRKDYGVSFTPIGGGSDLNIKRLVVGEVDIAYSSSHPMHEAYLGKHPAATPEQAKDMRMLFCMEPSIYHLLARKSSGIKSPADLKGKRFACSFTTAKYIRRLAEAMLKGYGIDPKDVNILNADTASNGIQYIKDRAADAYFFPHPPPLHLMEELIVEYDCMLIPVGDEKARDLMLQTVSGHFREAIPAKCYKNNTEPLQDLPTVSMLNGFTAKKDFSSRFLEIWMDELLNPKYHEKLVQINPVMKQWTIENALKNAPVMPYHDAAIKYYKSRGVWTKDLEMKQQELLGDRPK